MLEGISDSPGWKMHALQNHDDGAHNCFGTTSGTAVLRLKIPVPQRCETTENCRIVMEYLRSWNSSYIGTAECALTFKNSPVNYNLTIDGQDCNFRRMEFSLPCPTRDFAIPSGAQSIILSISNKTPDRLVCLSLIRISINQIF